MKGRNKGYPESPTMQRLHDLVVVASDPKMLQLLDDTSFRHKIRKAEDHSRDLTLNRQNVKNVAVKMIPEIVDWVESKKINGVIPLSRPIEEGTRAFDQEEYSQFHHDNFQTIREYFSYFHNAISNTVSGVILQWLINKKRIEDDTYEELSDLVFERGYELGLSFTNKPPDEGVEVLAAGIHTAIRHEILIALAVLETHSLQRKRPMTKAQFEDTYQNSGYLSHELTKLPMRFFANIEEELLGKEPERLKNKKGDSGERDIHGHYNPDSFTLEGSYKEKTMRLELSEDLVHRLELRLPTLVVEHAVGCSGKESVIQLQGMPPQNAVTWLQQTSTAAINKYVIPHFKEVSERVHDSFSR